MSNRIRTKLDLNGDSWPISLKKGDVVDFHRFIFTLYSLLSASQFTCQEPRPKAKLASELAFQNSIYTWINLSPNLFLFSFSSPVASGGESPSVLSPSQLYISYHWPTLANNNGITRQDVWYAPKLLGLDLSRYS